jgi:hypothetical protein
MSCVLISAISGVGSFKEMNIWFLGYGPILIQGVWRIDFHVADAGLIS